MNETPYYLIKNSATEYKVVYPEVHGSYIDTAVKELRTFLGEISPGITIKVSSDTGLTHSADAKYISLGDTALLQSAGISVDKEKLGSDGYAIITKDQSVYLVGGSTHGTLFAVYEFLEKQFGYHFYAKDCYDLERNVTEKKLLDFNLTVTPSIAVRYMADGQFVSSKDNESALRMRSTPQDDFIVRRTGQQRRCRQLAYDAAYPAEGRKPGASRMVRIRQYGRSHPALLCGKTRRVGYGRQKARKSRSERSC